MKLSCFACREPVDSPSLPKSWTRVTLGPESDKRIIQRIEGYQKEPRQLDICGPCATVLVSWLLVERGDCVRDSCPDCEDYTEDEADNWLGSSTEQITLPDGHTKTTTTSAFLNETFKKIYFNEKSRDILNHYFPKKSEEEK